MKIFSVLNLRTLPVGQMNRFDFFSYVKPDRLEFTLSGFWDFTHPYRIECLKFCV
ncbi:hypothetical protein LEP1GSC036_0691 [Leptospira weilii str. 2006001853]|uniref:Uncharacterized protein n=1 Tax=Leptospira weilii str. 2006001853 TaxID=1001589 RepID=A0A828Z6S6_9LEPT|nr:hypothetical protein LEP1GSC036_0691 [Leptospira weilii str. 2006001853]EMN46722.1 hypothetical protein LEP1GSC086_4149 [Leptospira weilii str. LNT 1234]